MENKGVCCDVCECIHNCGCNKCNLGEVHITEQCSGGEKAMETPHFCCDYKAK